MQWFFADDAYLHWLILGIVLIIAEIFLPSFFLLWLGLAAGLLCVLLLIFPDLHWLLQLTLFATLSCVSIVAARLSLRRVAEDTDQPHLNRRAEQHVGKVYIVEEAIVAGAGKLKVGDTLWNAEGGDCPSGQRVRVVSVAGNTLQVEPEST